LRWRAALEVLRLSPRSCDPLAVSLDVSRELARPTLRALLAGISLLVLPLAAAAAAALGLTHAVRNAVRSILRRAGLAHLTTHRFGRLWRSLVNFHLGHILL
jgi:hypothetical protein